MLSTKCLQIIYLIYVYKQVLKELQELQDDWSPDLKKTTTTHYVIYWPSTEPSIKRCTCVNKRKNSGNRCTLDNNITRCPGRFEWVGERMPAWEPACRLRVWRSSVTHSWAAQPGCERNAATVRRTLGQYVVVCPRLQLISHAQPTSPF